MAYNGHRVNSIPRVDLTAIFGLFVGIIFAVLIALIGPFMALPIAGLAGLMASFFFSVDTLVVLAWLSGAVLAGTLEYATGVSQGFWIPYLMGILLALHGLLRGHLVSTQAFARPQGEVQERVTMSVLTVILILWFVNATFSTVVSAPDVAQILVAVKNYVFLWGVLIAIVLSRSTPKALLTFWLVVVGVACLQFPIALYQRFFVASRRSDAASWDAVVGTFGGNPDGGGHSAAMALVACIALAVVLVRWKNGQISTWRTLPIGALCLAPIMLAEVKMVFIWLPLLALVIFGSDIRRHFVRSTVLFALALGLIGGMAVVYKAAFYDTKKSRSWEQVFEKQIKYAVDPEEYNIENRRLGRIASLKFWYSKNSLDDPLHLLVGYGLGSSRSSSSLSVGHLAARYPFSIDVSAASTLLWDTGLIGASLFFALLAGGSVYGLVWSRRAGLSKDWQQLCFISGTVLLLILAGFAYNRDSIDTSSVQLLLMVAVAQTLLARRAAIADGK